MSGTLTASQEQLLYLFTFPNGELDPHWYQTSRGVEAAGRLVMAPHYDLDPQDDVQAALGHIYTAFGLADTTTEEIAASILDVTPELADRWSDTSRRKQAVKDSIEAYAGLMDLDPLLPAALAEGWGIRNPYRYDTDELDTQAQGLKMGSEVLVMTAVHDWNRAYGRIAWKLSTSLTPQASTQFYEAATSAEASFYLDQHANNNEPAKRLILVAHGTKQGKIVMSSKPGTKEHKLIEVADFSDLVARGIIQAGGSIALAGCYLGKGGRKSTAAQMAQASGLTVYACRQPVDEVISRGGKPLFITDKHQLRLLTFTPQRSWRMRWQERKQADELLPNAA